VSSIILDAKFISDVSVRRKGMLWVNLARASSILIKQEFCA